MKKSSKIINIGTFVAYESINLDPCENFEKSACGNVNNYPLILYMWFDIDTRGLKKSLKNPIYSCGS